METVDQRISQFYDSIGEDGVFSTAAQVVYYPGPLYNVDGSSHDPHINGYTWIGLLKHLNVTGNCYVVDAPHDTHPQFNVGGHMTPNSDGSVIIGGVCYLMPLCYWHNSTARNHVPFALTTHRIVQLSGYMQGELALTFIARMPTLQPYSIIYQEKGDWHTQPISQAQFDDKEAIQLAHCESAGLPEQYILLRKEEANGQIRFKRERAQI